MTIHSREFLKRFAVAAFALTVSLGANAGKGGKVSGSISLELEAANYLVDGAAAAALPDGFPRYGDAVGFAVNVSGASDSETWSALRCFQDDVTVLVDRQNPDHAYLLSNEVSPSREWDGGSASCTAALVYCPTKGKDRGTCMTLDSTEFAVTGSETQ